MKILIKQNEFFEKVLPKQEYNYRLKYRLLHFCVKEIVDEGIIIYNNLSKQLVLISKEEHDLLERSKYTEPQNLIKELIEFYYLVPQDHDDMALSNQVRDISRMLEHSNGINHFTILTTTGCNARCFYCFEAGIPISNMNAAVANDVADYIIKKRNPNAKVHIQWFGGEPLCNQAAIDIISKRLDDESIIYTSTMTTNGFLFNKKLAERVANDWKLQSVQITLDGCAETYNRVKDYVCKPANAFETVIDNIELLLKNNIGVRVRLNLDFYNFNELFELVTFLHKKFKCYKRFSMYSYPLFEKVENNYSVRTDADRSELTKKFIELQNFIKSLGIFIPKKFSNGITVRQCKADSDSATIVFPEGQLGCCEHVSDNFYSNIYEDLPKKPWRDYCEPLDKCNICAAYPSCIRLKGCNSGRTECFDYEQFIRIEDIRDGARKLYKKSCCDIIK